jgi:hypothetical protein
MFSCKFSMIFGFYDPEKRLSKMLTYISSLFVGIEIWKFRVTCIYMQEIRCPSLSIFGFVIREKKQFFWEGPRLLAHPLFHEKRHNFRFFRTLICRKGNILFSWNFQGILLTNRTAREQNFRLKNGDPISWYMPCHRL